MATLGNHVLDEKRYRLNHACLEYRYNYINKSILLYVVNACISSNKGYKVWIKQETWYYCQLCMNLKLSRAISYMFYNYLLYIWVYHLKQMEI